MKKEFLYMIQGRAKLVPELSSLINSKNADLISLTFDKELDGSYFLPNSTWLEGRNLLLKKAKEKVEKYTYYIFLDDDIVFERGSFEVFEKYLLKYQPAIAHPFYLTKWTTYKDWWRKFITYPEVVQDPSFDEMFVAIHKDLVEDEILVPYLEDFQNLSWYSAGKCFNFFMNLFYKDLPILRINPCVVTNKLNDWNSRPLENYLPPLKSLFRDGVSCSNELFEECLTVRERNAKDGIEYRSKFSKFIYKILKYGGRRYFGLWLSFIDWLKEIKDFRKIKNYKKNKSYAVLHKKYDWIIANSQLDKSLKNRKTLTL